MALEGKKNKNLYTGRRRPSYQYRHQILINKQRVLIALMGTHPPPRLCYYYTITSTTHKYSQRSSSSATTSASESRFSPRFHFGRGPHSVRIVRAWGPLGQSRRHLDTHRFCIFNFPIGNTFHDRLGLYSDSLNISVKFF